MNSNRVKRKKIVFNDPDIISTKEVGRLFKKFRESIDKDQQKLASELNNSQGSISRIERAIFTRLTPNGLRNN